MFNEESRILSLEEGRRLLAGTGLAHISDEELLEVLESVRAFCEICFDMQSNRAKNGRVFYLSTEEGENTDVSQAA